MSKVQSKSSPSDEVIRDLQEMLLKAVLLVQRLPGCNQPIIFPDLSFILNQPTIVLINENLAGTVSIEESPKPVCILSQEALLQEASTQGDINYLRFQTPIVEDNAVRLTLEAKIAPRDPEQRTLGLGGIQVKFQEVEGQWEAADEPIFFAI